MLTNITNQERNRFKKFQEQGMLPSVALKKLENERKFGITDTTNLPSKLIDSNTLFYASLGVIGLTIVYVYIKNKSSTTPVSLMKSNNDINLYNIDGLNIKNLEICKQKGLI